MKLKLLLKLTLVSHLSLGVALASSQNPLGSDVVSDDQKQTSSSSAGVAPVVSSANSELTPDSAIDASNFATVTTVSSELDKDDTSDKKKEKSKSSDKGKTSTKSKEKQKLESTASSSSSSSSMKTKAENSFVFKVGDEDLHTHLYGYSLSQYYGASPVPENPSITVNSQNRFGQGHIGALRAKIRGVPSPDQVFFARTLSFPPVAVKNADEFEKELPGHKSLEAYDVGLSGRQIDLAERGLSLNASYMKCHNPVNFITRREEIKVALFRASSYFSLSIPQEYEIPFFPRGVIFHVGNNQEIIKLNGIFDPAKGNIDITFWNISQIDILFTGGKTPIMIQEENEKAMSAIRSMMAQKLSGGSSSMGTSSAGSSSSVILHSDDDTPAAAGPMKATTLVSSDDDTQDESEEKQKQSESDADE